MYTWWKTALIAGAALVATASCAGNTPTTPAAAAAPVGDPSRPAAGAAAAVDVVGLVDGKSLVRFTTADPTATGEPATVSGLDGDTRLIGIDHRVQDGKLYGVGDEGGLYSLTETGTATRVGELSVPLDGEVFGVDFNPAANALRIISDTGQNLRQPFATTPLPDTVADTELTNPAQAPATGTVPATGVVSAAYTNNDTEDTTATSLFVLDAKVGRISLQSPANGGTLAPTGSLGVDPDAGWGFDIHTDPDGVNTGYATLKVGSGYELHSVDLLTGAATRIGTLDGTVTDIAVALR
ncbi:uncharacterized protein DUF4394 [Pseudonocardia hierapolitana]|uniref:Uncharacterized protein DUF4394 n=1 Tax=Pseudonocardia hierapolitana TaxID=1128676 RepID=A0A561T1Y9_9PSEU|nr:DUF4394 domain-containing protein [Pseudonocardia hierapolitana]TWF81121.1 uncharacterized protein DUF4394 [Pseudonocardia hierapolitana]